MIRASPTYYISVHPEPKVLHLHTLFSHHAVYTAAISCTTISSKRLEQDTCCLQHEANASTVPVLLPCILQFVFAAVSISMFINGSSWKDDTFHHPPMTQIFGRYQPMPSFIAVGIRAPVHTRMRHPDGPSRKNARIMCSALPG